VAALILIIGATAPMAIELITVLLIFTAVVRRDMTRTRETSERSVS
jgi:hypothetical protein